MGGTDDDITVFGETDWRGHRRRFGIKRKDRRAHMYLIGKTGMGKGTLLQTLIVADLRRGEGLAVIDPQGDLVRRMALMVPPERAGAVVDFDPASRLVAFNPPRCARPFPPASRCLRARVGVQEALGGFVGAGT